MLLATGQIAARGILKLPGSPDDEARSDDGVGAARAHMHVEITVLESLDAPHLGSKPYVEVRVIGQRREIIGVLLARRMLRVEGVGRRRVLGHGVQVERARPALLVERPVHKLTSESDAQP